MGQKAPILATTLTINTANASGILLTTNDAAVGKNLTFSPDRVLPNGAVRYVDRTGSIPAGFPVTTFMLRPPSQGNRNYKMSQTVVLPTLETLGTSSQSGYLPGQKVGYQCTGRVEFVIPERATLTERNAIFSALVSMLATSIQAVDGTPIDATSSVLRNAVVNLESVY